MNHSSNQDTIVAPATAPGRAAVAIVRLSGTKAWDFASLIFPALTATAVPRMALVGTLRTAEELVDEVLALPFRGPRSYTGEDLVEFHLHGNDLLVSGVIRALTQAGARPAEPGEFTRRAYLNGKLDLARAEAVAELIDARSRHAAQGAAARLAGSLSERYKGIRQALLELLCHLEATIDFPDEDIETLGYPRLEADIRHILADLQRLADTFEQGRLDGDGLRVGIAGRPNAGKSSLMNALLGTDRAIVTELAGTTRDYLEEPMSLAGSVIQLLDTAGLREALDRVEAEGIRRARSRLRESNLLLYVVDAARPLELDELTEARALTDGEVLLVVNKVDLGKAPKGPLDMPTFPVSALTGEGLPALLSYIAAKAQGSDQDFGFRVASARQARLIVRSMEALRAVSVALNQQRPPELAVADLREAVAAVGELTGDIVNDEVLGEIFSRFCVGK
jgi:tRNA modification GTPase